MLLERLLTCVVHFAPWYRNQMRLELGESLMPLVEASTNLDIRADFVSDQTALNRYLDKGFGNSYDFDQTP